MCVCVCVVVVVVVVVVIDVFLIFAGHGINVSQIEGLECVLKPEFCELNQ